MQAGEQSEQIFTRWRAGAYNAWSLPGRCFIVLEELRWGAFGDACRLGSPQAVALLLGDLRVKATQHLAESINAAPTTRHYYHQRVTITIRGLPLRPFRRAGSMLIF